MERHQDFEKIHGRFVTQFGERKGSDKYSTWLKSKGFDESKEFPKNKENKELTSRSLGIEVKETGDAFHLEGLIATDHVDNYHIDIGMSDIVPVETLDSFAEQINTRESARVMGVHHSEGAAANPEYFGVADIENTPAKVIDLNDGHKGLFVDTVLLKDDPKTPEIIEDFQKGELNSFSITYDASSDDAVDFDVVNGEIVRVLKPSTVLYGYTAASRPVNPNAVATAYGFKEFKELVGKDQLNGKEVKKMPEENSEKIEEQSEQGVEAPAEEASVAEESVAETSTPAEDPELKELRDFKAYKSKLEAKEALKSQTEAIASAVVSKMEVKEKVLKSSPTETAKEVALEVKEFVTLIEKPASVEVKEQFRRAAALCEHLGLDWRTAKTSSAESREFKSFGVNGRNLEYKGLGIDTNSTTYTQSSAELQDVYDPVIYNALNQATVFWNVLSKDDYSQKGNNQVQFTLKIAANASAAFYTGNTVTTGNVTREKYQTKFKKIQVGVAVDGDMIAAARGGPVSDVFAQEVLDSTMDMLSVLNAALFAEVGLEAAAGVIGLEYITDSVGNTSLYGLTRSAANKLAPDAATDTYIDGAAAAITMTNLRAGIRQAILEGANKSNLIYVTNPVQADKLRGQFDAQRRHLSSSDTSFGFTTDLYVDGVPVFEDKDCNADDWFCVDLETHRVGIWVPATIENLGKTDDSASAFIKSYLAVYNRAPRRMVQIYNNAV